LGRGTRDAARGQPRGRTLWQAAGQWASRGDVPCGTLWQIGRFSNHFKRIQAILFAWYWRDMKMFTGSWDYTRFKKAFYAKTGLNLDCYKDKQMERRIRQMMLRENRPDFNLFYNYLSVNLPAMERFCHYLTINTSEFFRDGNVFNCLEKDVFPQLLKNYPQGLKIWSAGCSMGAEPLSIAIILHKLNALRRAKVLATDIDENVLMVAQKGCFNQRYLSKTPNNLLQRYFKKDGENYWIKDVLKKAVIFKKHNLLIDKPIPGCHMILCRNVFIYFKSETQKLLLERFSCSLEPGGFLVIGSAEYINNPGKYGLSKLQNTIFQKQ
jgi:chemotaxis protein methyltransferase CheR